MYIIHLFFGYLYNLCGCFGCSRKVLDNRKPVMTAREIIMEMERMPSEEKSRVFWHYVKLRREHLQQPQPRLRFEAACFQSC